MDCFSHTHSNSVDFVVMAKSVVAYSIWLTEVVLHLYCYQNLHFLLVGAVVELQSIGTESSLQH